MSSAHTPSLASHGPPSAWAARVRAVLLFYLALVPVFFCYRSLDPFELFKAGLSHLCALALLALAVGAALHSSRQRVRACCLDLFRHPVSLVVLAGVFWAAVTTAFSVSPRLSFWGASQSQGGFVSVLALAVLFFATRSVCACRGTAAALLSAVLAGTAVSAGYALVQAAGWDPLRWANASGFQGWHRPGGGVGHPNALAGLLAMVLPLAVWLNHHRRGEGRSRIPGWFVMALCAALLVTLISRAAWAAVALAAAVLTALWPRERRLARIAAAAGVGVAAVGGLLVLGGPRLSEVLLLRLQHLGDSPGREALWQTAWRLFLDHPWLGTGPDTFGLVFPQVRTPAFWQAERFLMPRHTHNDFLQALVTGGVPGGLVYLALPCLLLWSTLRAWKCRPEDRPLVAAAAAAVAAFYVQNAAGFALTVTSSVFVVLAAVLSRLAGPPGEPRGGEVDVALWPGHLALVLGGASLVTALLVQDSGPAGGAVVAVVTLTLFAAFLLGKWRNSSPWHPPLPTPWLPRLGVAGTAAVCLVAGWYGVGTRWTASYLCVSGPLEGDARTVLAAYERAVRTAPGWDEVHAELAGASLQVADQLANPERKRKVLERADRAILAACELEPRCAVHHTSRARILAALSRLDGSRAAEVLPAFARAVELDPCDTVCLLDAAKAALVLGDVAQAREYLRRAGEVDPGGCEVRIEMGTLALVERRFLDARRHLEEVLDTVRHDEVEQTIRCWRLLAYVYLELGIPDRALHVAEHVLARCPDDQTMTWLRGEVLERLERYRKMRLRWSRRDRGTPQVRK